METRRVDESFPKLSNELRDQIKDNALTTLKIKIYEEQEIKDLVYFLESNTSLTSLAVRFDTYDLCDKITLLKDGINRPGRFNKRLNILIGGLSRHQRLYLQELDLSGNLINDSGARSIGNYLQLPQATSLRKLNLANNAIGYQGTQNIANALRTHKKLSSLDLSYNQISGYGLASIFSLLPSCLTLQTVYTHHNKINNIVSEEFTAINTATLRLFASSIRPDVIANPTHFFPGNLLSPSQDVQQQIRLQLEEVYQFILQRQNQQAAVLLANSSTLHAANTQFIAPQIAPAQTSLSNIPMSVDIDIAQFEDDLSCRINYVLMQNPILVWPSDEELKDKNEKEKLSGYTYEINTAKDPRMTRDHFNKQPIKTTVPNHLVAKMISHYLQAIDEHSTDQEKIAAKNLFVACMICPLSKKIMQNPAMTMAGNTYEKSAIEEHIKKYHTDPLSGQKLADESVIPNQCVKDVITTYHRLVQTAENSHIAPAASMAPSATPIVTANAMKLELLQALLAPLQSDKNKLHELCSKLATATSNSTDLYDSFVIVNQLADAKNRDSFDYATQLTNLLNLSLDTLQQLSHVAMSKEDVILASIFSAIADEKSKKMLQALPDEPAPQALLPTPRALLTETVPHAASPGPLSMFHHQLTPLVMQRRLIDTIILGSLESVKKCIAEGAKLTEPDEQGNHPLEAALTVAKIDIVNYILHNLAETDKAQQWKKFGEGVLANLNRQLQPFDKDADGEFDLFKMRDLCKLRGIVEESTKKYIPAPSLY